MRYQRFFADLKRRRVFRSAAVYGGIAFIVVQAADFLVPALRFPDWVATLIAVTVILGFPVSMIVAWFFDFTPSGVLRTDPAGEGELEAIVAQPPRRRWPAGVLALAGVGLLGGSVWWTFGREVGFGGGGSPGEGPAGASIAVLPCENFSPDPEDAYLASGLHEEILFRLSKISSLLSIGRESVRGYADNPLPVPAIAAELGVGFIGECSVRKDEDQIRLTFQVLDGDSGGQVWTDSYDAILTAGNLFEMQADLAQKIARAMRVVLAPEERSELDALPTSSTAAYGLYLRGLSIQGDAGRTGTERYDRSHRLAVQLFEEASQTDPNFAAAPAAAAIAHCRLFFGGNDQTEQRMALARTSLDRALALAPEDPQVQMAEGWYQYACVRDYDRALEAYSRARARMPGNADVLARIGFAHRRKGDLEEAASFLEQAVTLAPRSAEYVRGLARTMIVLGDFSEARAQADRCRALQPELPSCYVVLLHITAASLGIGAEVERLVGEIPEFVDPEHLASIRYWLHFFERDFASAARILEEGGGDFVGEAFGAASIQAIFLPRELMRGFAYGRAGERERARTDFAASAGKLEPMKLASPGDHRVAQGLALTYAGLGRRDEAVREAERAMAIMPPSRDMWEAASLFTAAWVHAELGEAEAAAELLWKMKEVPSAQSWKLSPHVLRADPRWDRIRDHPSFQALLEEGVSQVGL